MGHQWEAPDGGEGAGGQNWRALVGKGGREEVEVGSSKRALCPMQPQHSDVKENRCGRSSCMHAGPARLSLPEQHLVLLRPQPSVGVTHAVLMGLGSLRRPGLP